MADNKMMTKLRILLFWGYHRDAWTRPFKQLDHYFEFIYIWHNSPSTEYKARPDIAVRYFSEFSSIQHMLEVIKPDKVIFLGLKSVLAAMINATAKQKGIQTVLIQHGIQMKLPDQIKESKQGKSGSSKRLLGNRKPSKFAKCDDSFLWNSVRPGNFIFFLRLKWNKYWHRGILGSERISKLRSSQRLADRYLLSSPYADHFYLKRDRVAGRIEYIGNTEADEIITQSKAFETNKNSPYLLHIDMPILHITGSADRPKYTTEEGIDFYERLNKAAANAGLRLVIKLHPTSFDFLHLYPKSPNIEYVLNHDSLVQLLQESSLVTGFYSTLLLPAMWLKPTVAFEFLEGLELMADMQEIYGGTVVPFKVTADQLTESLMNAKVQRSEQFERDFFYKVDGGALERLKNALLRNYPPSKLSSPDLHLRLA